MTKAMNERVLRLEERDPSAANRTQIEADARAFIEKMMRLMENSDNPNPDAEGRRKMSPAQLLAWSIRYGHNLTVADVMRDRLSTTPLEETRI